MKKVLVIHPKDKTTEFLKPIYKNIKDVTIITGGLNKEKLIEQINNHDRVIMLGHGSSSGLFSMGKFDTGPYVIDKSIVPYLENKENIFIWCHANQFVNSNNLKGFSSGMFVSEVSESIYCKIPSDQKTVDVSNNLFAAVVGECINESLDKIYNNARHKYGLIKEINPVANYNWQRLEMLC
jgi:hypothetical protein